MGLFCRFIMPKPSRKRKAPARLGDDGPSRNQDSIVGLQVPVQDPPQQPSVQATTAPPIPSAMDGSQQHQSAADSNSVTFDNPGTVQWPTLSHPTPLQGASSELGLGVQQSTRDKIAQGLFVDMSVLLPGKDNSPSGHKLGLSVDGQFMLTPNSGRKITTIEEWSDAFLIFSSLYLATHPGETQAVLKYFSTIRLAAKRHLGLGWQSYDTQFRLRLAANPLASSFAIVDPELWLLCMGPSTLFSMGGDKKCYNFNWRQCTRAICSYRHSCLNCSGNHPARACRANNAGHSQSARGGTYFSPRQFAPRAQARPSFRPRFSQFRPRF